LGWDNLHEQPLTVSFENQTFLLHPLVEKRGFKVYLCNPNARGKIPPDSVLRKIEREVTRYAYEHLIIYVDTAREKQVWQWVKREQGARSAPRLNRYHKGQSGELLAQKLEKLAIALAEEDKLHMADVAGRVAKAFDVERVTRKFYDRFKLEHSAFLNLIAGIEARADREWYASLMLNRLMFIYFIQRKGFLDTHVPGKLDGDPNYLTNRLKRVQQERGENEFHTFYRYFLLKLFHDGLSKREHSAELEALLGKVPYLNGGLFDLHVLERDNPEINIPDEAFEKLFSFFDDFDWHLDDRPLRNDREINPDVLGYIFEKYINQKQMGAYYTKEDITEYISKNTIIPYIFDAAEQKCLIAFRPDGPVWSLLRENPDAYIYDAVKKGCDLPLPPEIEEGVHDVSRRGEWNKHATEEYALPAEIWREVAARRNRYFEVKAKLAAGEIASINDLVTYNLDMRRFAEDIITYCEGTDLLRAFYDSIQSVTVLDPTCGSGAFLFAALNILETLYEACLERMQDLVEEREALDAAIPVSKRRSHPDINHFREILNRVQQHPSRKYFIYKSIIINNLYGVDIMEEATEICKLRLFLKLVSQVEQFDDIEPLPDIDFNIRAGNTLVGFASQEETKQAIQGKATGKGTTRDEVAFQNQMIFDDRLDRIEQKAQEIERDFDIFRKLQTQLQLDSIDMAENKQQIRQKLGVLRAELDGYLASEYGIDRHNIKKKEEYDEKFTGWQQSHQPFHWWVEFYGIMKSGGFDVIIGNPPYVEYSKVRGEYQIYDYRTENCGNLYAFTIERSFSLMIEHGRFGMIVQLSSICTDRMSELQDELRNASRRIWISNYDDRPAKLFDGLEHIRASIIITQNTKSDNSDLVINATNLLRWYTECRSKLFDIITYDTVAGLDIPGSIPKIGNNQLKKLISKVRDEKRSVGVIYSQGSAYRVYYYRSPLYWIRGMDFLPTFASATATRSVHHFKDFYVASEQYVKPVGCLINSSLFYLWFIVYGNGRNVALRDIQTFPCDLEYLSLQQGEALNELFTELMQDYKDHSQTKVRKDGVKFQEFYPSFSKPIMDEIDRVLTRHYGFTDEELDFIINYDIKYRMGRDNGDESEE
jgi:hypothetical protein